MPNKLKVKRLDEVSFVDKGANPHAKIAIWKRDVGKMDHPALTFNEAQATAQANQKIWEHTDRLSMVLRNIAEAGDDDLPVGKDRNALITQSLAEFTATMEAALTKRAKESKVKKTTQKDVTKRVEKQGEKWIAFNADDEIIGEFDTEAAAEAAVEASKATKKDEPTDMVAKAEFDALNKRLQQAEQKANDAEKLAKHLEHEKRRTIYIQKAAALNALPGVTGDDTGALLHEIADAFGDTDEGKAKFAKLEQVLSAANTAVRQGKLYAEIGSAGGDLGSVAAEVSAEVEKIRKAEPKLSEQAARGKVWATRPDLHARYDAERQERSAQH